MNTANLVAASGVIVLVFGLATLASTIVAAYSLSQVTFQDEARWDGTVTINFIQFDLQRYDVDVF